ncbi:MAG: hypothetical protein ACE5JL_16745, partial [Dehalococcoidia bacterium]
LGSGSNYRVFLQNTAGNVVTIRSIGTHDKAESIIEYRAMANPATGVKGTLELYGNNPGWDLRWKSDNTRYRFLIDGTDKDPPSSGCSSPCTGSGPNLPAVAATDANGKSDADAEYDDYDNEWSGAGSCLSCDGGAAAGLVTNLGGTNKLGKDSIIQVADTYDWEALAQELDNSPDRTISSDLDGVNQTWGSSSSPEIVLIDDSRIEDSTITGYGVLLLKNDVRLRGNTTFNWEGLVIIYGAASDFRFETDSGTANIYGSVVLTGEDRRLDLDSGDRLNVYYSSLALSNTAPLFGSVGGWGGSVSWRLVRNY